MCLTEREIGHASARAPWLPSVVGPNAGLRVALGTGAAGVRCVRELIGIRGGAGLPERDGPPADVLIIFGITGDLARKMTFRALYRLERRKLLDCPVVGVASDDITVDELVTQAREAITTSGEKIDDAVFDRLANRLSYLHGDVNDDALYESLAEHIGSGHHPLFYLEMPPTLFAPIVEQLGKADLLERPASPSRSRSATT